MPAEDHRQLAARAGGHADERRPLHAVDRPGLFDKSFGRLGREQIAELALGRQRSGADQGEAKEEEMAHK